jgi:hypothetical protein
MWFGIEKALLCGRYDRRMSASIRKNVEPLLQPFGRPQSAR